jgi:hypothetical protein
MKTSETFACDGRSRTFSCPFQALAAGDVRCYLIDAAGARPLTLNIDFTVFGIGAPSVAVQTVFAHPAESMLRCERRTALTDAGDVRQLAFLVQELAADHERAAMVPHGERLSELPARAKRARKVMAFDANGDLIALVGIDKASAAWLQLMLADTAYDNTGAGMVAYRENIDYDAGSIGAALHDLARRIDGLGG